MTKARAVAVILLPPEWRPTDPYPPHVPDYPEWVFESYENYWYWLGEREIRVAIHDPRSGETDVRRIARPTINLNNLATGLAWNRNSSASVMCPMGAGLLFVGEVHTWAGVETRIEFCRYSTESELVPPEAVATLPSGYQGHPGYMVAGQQSVAICWPGWRFGESIGLVYVFTPDPEIGGIPLATIEAPNFNDGTGGADYRYMAAEMGEQLRFVSTEYGF